LNEAHFIAEYLSSFEREKNLNMLRPFSPKSILKTSPSRNSPILSNHSRNNERRRYQLAVLAFVVFLGMITLNDMDDSSLFGNMIRTKEGGRRSLPIFSRKLSIDFGDGTCVWTKKTSGEDDDNSDDVDSSEKPFGTLFASYPESGMSITWQENNNEKVGKKKSFTGDIVGLVQTQYPYKEDDEAWNQEEKPSETTDQVIMVVRNPRWAIPSHTSSTVRAQEGRKLSVWDWVKWRDSNFEDELKMWAHHIDFWMENGTQFWVEDEGRRLGQMPYHHLEEGSDAFPRDKHCEKMDCVPKTVISYESLKNNVTGPQELQKIANALRNDDEIEEGFMNQTDYNVTSDGTALNNTSQTEEEVSTNVDEGVIMNSNDTMDCVWHSNFVDALGEGGKDNSAYDLSVNNHDEENGEISAQFNFTGMQMNSILTTLVRMHDKYSRGKWDGQQIATDITSYLENYISDVETEIGGMTKRRPIDFYDTTVEDNYLDETKDTTYHGIGQVQLEYNATTP